MLRYGGLTHLFFVDGAEPATIRHVHSRNWVDWDAGERIQVPGAKVGALNVFRQGPDLLLFASVDDGGHRTHLLASRDLRQWSPVAALPDSYGSAA